MVKPPNILAPAGVTSVLTGKWSNSALALSHSATATRRGGDFPHFQRSCANSPIYKACVSRISGLCAYLHRCQTSRSSPCCTCECSNLRRLHGGCHVNVSKDSWQHQAIDIARLPWLPGTIAHGTHNGGPVAVNPSITNLGPVHMQHDAAMHADPSAVARYQLCKQHQDEVPSRSVNYDTVLFYHLSCGISLHCLPGLRTAISLVHLHLDRKAFNAETMSLLFSKVVPSGSGVSRGFDA